MLDLRYIVYRDNSPGQPISFGAFGYVIGIFDSLELLNDALEIELNLEQFLDDSPIRIRGFLIESMFANEVIESRIFP